MVWMPRAARHARDVADRKHLSRQVGDVADVDDFVFGVIARSTRPPAPTGSRGTGTRSS